LILSGELHEQSVNDVRVAFLILMCLLHAIGVHLSNRFKN